MGFILLATVESAAWCEFEGGVGNWKSEVRSSALLVLECLDLMMWSCRVVSLIGISKAY